MCVSVKLQFYPECISHYFFQIKFTSSKLLYELSVKIYFFFYYFVVAGIAQSLQRLATGCTVGGSNSGGARFVPKINLLIVSETLLCKYETT